MNNDRPVASRIRVQSGVGEMPTVDQHPGWVQQSVRQYMSLCIVAVAMHVFFAGAGPVLSGARSAAWWVVAVGSIGGLLIWLPMWGMMRREKAITINEAMTEAYGKIVSNVIIFLYTILAIFDTSITIRVLGSVVRQFLIINANEMVVSSVVIAVLMVVIGRHGDQGLSRLFWLIRLVVLFSLAVVCVAMLRNGYIENLFPILGNDTKDTLMQLPAAASGYLPLLMFGILPLQTGSAKPTRFRTGLIVIAIGGLIATALMLVVNLSMPPRAVMDQMVWGFRLMVPAEYMQSGLWRMIYLLTLVVMLLFSSGYGTAVSITWMQTALNTTKKTIPIAICCAAFVSIILLSNQQYTDAVIHSLVWRLPIAAIPLWMTWGILLAKRRKGIAKG